VPLAPAGARHRTGKTAERILVTALDLFNRRGEPQVSTTLIAAELDISPGNLYYHYPAKDTLVNALLARYEAELDASLARATMAATVAASAQAGDGGGTDPLGQLLGELLTLGWRYRFLFRDLNDLLARNRVLETRCQAALARQDQTLRDHVSHRARRLGQPLPASAADALACQLGLVLTYWLCHEYVRDPRHALEPESEASLLASGQAQLQALLAAHGL
jgi:AcrR family transcriptional regulator